MDKPMTGVSTLSKFIPAIVRRSFLNTTRSQTSTTETGVLRFPVHPSMTLQGWVYVTIRQKMGGSFADGEMYFSSISPKTKTRSTKTYRVAVNFRDTARADTERLLADQDGDITRLMAIRGELNWINHKRGPNPIINVDWFRICETPQDDH